MICFLTSLPWKEDTGKLDPANGFLDEMRRCVKSPCRMLLICSDPEDEDNDRRTEATAQDFINEGIEISSVSVLDGRNPEQAEELIHNSDLIILDGGHVPTQNRFFSQIGLRELLKSYDGVVLGISAGTMNSADEVYAEPEEEGEALDPDYELFIPGLSLTNNMILPHYYDKKGALVDGLRVIEDITLPNSMGKVFYYLPDGSYLFIENGVEELRGEAYLVSDGEITKISDCGEIYPLKRWDNRWSELDTFAMAEEIAAVPFTETDYLNAFYDFYEICRSRDQKLVLYEGGLYEGLADLAGPESGSKVAAEAERLFGLPLRVLFFEDFSKIQDELEGPEGLAPFFFVFDIMFCEYEDFTLCFICGTNN